MASAVGQTQEQLAQRVRSVTAELRRERDEAEHSAEARSRFFAAASHDLRQPAHALGLFVSQLKRRNKAQELQGDLRQLGRAIDNLQGLLATLLDYSRLDGKVVRIEPRPVRARSAIGPILDGFAAAAAEKGLVLRSRLADCWLLTDPALFHRIVINLVGNAVRHTRAGGILVACRRGADTARLEIWDTGPGIAAEYRETIFDELVQLDNPERDVEKGLGLGLAIVKKSAALLGHPLSLCSLPGHGSRFSLRIPLAAPAAELPLPSAAAAAEDEATLLLVSPPAPARDAVAAQLAGWHYAVAREADLAAAEQWLLGQQTPVGVVFDLGGGSACVETVRQWRAAFAARHGRMLPALIVVDGPLPAPPATPEGEPPLLLLSRPFQPGRLRALLSRLCAEADDAGD